ncbi:MAG: hypothetical protein ACE5IL_13610 [Myxococcota bacterium]
MADASDDRVVRLLKRGLNHYGLGDLEAAIAAWEAAREIDPDNHAARDYLETAYEEAGREPPESGSAPAHVDIDDATPKSLPELEVQIDDPTPRSTPGVDSPAEDPTPSDSHPLGSLPAPEAHPGAPRSLEEWIEMDDPDTILEEALEAYRSGRLEDAWRALEGASERDPSRLDLRAYQEMVRNQLMEGWAHEIGDQGRVLRVKIEMADLMQMDLQPDEGFFLSQIDGALSIENLIHLSSLDRFRTLEILARLLREGIVA